MKFTQISAVAVAALVAGSAFAQAGPANSEFYPASDFMSMKMADKNRDGMVSKTEYMDMVTKAWAMNAKKMNVKNDMMTNEQFGELLKYLKAGG